MKGFCVQIQNSLALSHEVGNELIIDIVHFRLSVQTVVNTGDSVCHNLLQTDQIVGVAEHFHRKFHRVLLASRRNGQSAVSKTARE